MHAPHTHHTLTLSEDEAVTLHALLARLLGSPPYPETSEREQTAVGALRVFLVRCGRLPRRQT